MVLTIRATMRTPDDADAFNNLSVWCMKRNLFFDGRIEGIEVGISITGDADMLRELIAYLTEKQYGL